MHERMDGYVKLATFTNWTAILNYLTTSAVGLEKVAAYFSHHLDPTHTTVNLFFRARTSETSTICSTNAQ